MQKFDKYEVCFACANDPHESGKFWKPKFDKESQSLTCTCGVCGFAQQRGMACVEV